MCLEVTGKFCGDWVGGGLESHLNIRLWPTSSQTREIGMEICIFPCLRFIFKIELDSLCERHTCLIPFACFYFVNRKSLCGIATFNPSKSTLGGLRQKQDISKSYYYRTFGSQESKLLKPTKDNIK